jgi:hypothetical protein
MVAKRSSRIETISLSKHHHLFSSPDEIGGYSNVNNMKKKGGKRNADDFIIPRLHSDEDKLYKWIEENDGFFNADITQHSEGWSLKSRHEILKGEEIIRIPTNLCISSTPSDMNSLFQPLLESAKQLMESLSETQWRARLAIALLSERVRPDSFFTPYLQNLPFEYWGMPIFTSASELKYLLLKTIIKHIKTL